ncbi:MAG TPA: ABC transporter substrate-binding protein [Pseudolabrys sp.]|nr:ABC transporter substrate-binding protein [Pseudolabrys sp.]
MIGRVALVVTFAAVVALVLIFARPISQGAHALVDATSRLFGSSKSTDLLTASTATESTASQTRTASASVAAPVPAPVAQAPAANVQPAPAAVAQPAPTTVAQASSGGQQLSLSSPAQPLGQEPSGPKVMVRGVTDTEIRFGISAPFSGANKELGQNMRLGIEAAFDAANARGGVNGRQLKLIAADDGYEPARTAETMKRLYEKDQVFAVVGNVGTPTAAVALPYALDRKMIFFGAFTGAGLLRSDPPDRYVFNYRASYAEETAATVNYLVKVKRLKPSQIAVFAQQDAYGDAGFSGVAKAIRALGGDENAILRLHYQRNTVDVDDAVDQLRKSRIPIRAVIMVPGYRAAAKFIEKTRDLFPSMIYTSVSFVGSTALANELMLLGKKYANGVIVTQVVPALDGHSSLVLDYKAALAKYFPGEQPDYVSLEGYVAANVLITALRRNGADLDTEKLVTTLENLRDLDIGLGTPVSYGRSEHQGVHKVWGTQIDENGRYQPIDLQ